MRPVVGANNQIRKPVIREAESGRGSEVTRPVQIFPNPIRPGAGQYLVYANSGFTGTKQGAFTTDLDGLGGAIALRSSSTTVVDSVGYGIAANQYVEGVGAVLGILGQSIARKPNGTDTNNNLTDFAVLTTPTPGAAN